MIETELNIYLSVQTIYRNSKHEKFHGAGIIDSIAFGKGVGIIRNFERTLRKTGLVP